MNGERHRTLGELEDAHREENLVARRRVEQAHEYLSHYRSRMRTMQESLYEVAARHGAVDDPGFRAEFQHVNEQVDENVRGASAVVSRLEDEYDAGLARQDEEREELERLAGRA